MRTLLAEIAKQPSGYSLEKLMHRSYLHRPHAQIMGRLSVLNTIHKDYPNHPRLWRLHHKTGLFTMPVHVALLILQLEPGGILE